MSMVLALDSPIVSQTHLKSSLVIGHFPQVWLNITYVGYTYVIVCII